MASISFRNVSKSFGDVKAVRNVSFDIEDNEFFCLFGPPLSGKSTILKLILGLEKPDDGEILIGGKPVTQTSPAERNVAMVFQNLALFPHMTARQNLRFPLVERGIAEQVIAARVASVAEKLHISHLLHKHPAQLSGGERQRVAIGRALVRDPAAYLMDDPISALDARLREETRVELKRIQRELGHTLVYVTHDQEEAMSIADRIAILEQGEIRQTGSAPDLYDHPHSTYIAGLLGFPAINLVPVRVGQEALAKGTLALPPEKRVTGLATIGIRPENLKVEPYDAGRGLPPAHVFEVEPLGGYTVVTLAAGDEKLRALMRGQPEIRVETPVSISCDTQRMHMFGRNGQTLFNPQQTSDGSTA